MSNLVKWSLLGIGVVLIYAAFKNEKVKDVLSNVLKAPINAANTVTQ